MNYQEFISDKVPRAELMGFTPNSDPHPSLFPHQRDIAAWCCRGGQRAVFAAFGLGKTRIHLQVAKWVIEEQPEKKFLIIAPLGVRQEFTRVDAPAMDMELTYCRNDSEVAACNTPFIITNYERVGVGCPEYVLLLRKLPTDLSDAYADCPVRKDKEAYPRAHWQIDASSFYKSNGNRLPDPEILLNMPMDGIKRLWIEHSHSNGYDYREHIEIGKELEKLGKLPASFMLFPPVSNNPDIWSDIVRMRTLNSDQSKRNQENHVCPLQLDIIERLINRYSNKGEIVMDPFGGIGSVPYQAIKLGRTGWGIELNEEYWANAVGYCEQAEGERTVPTLFDMESFGLNAIASAI